MAKGNPNSPAAQAAAAAQASVPTRGSINSQYGQSIGDVEGFSKALLGLLQQGSNVGSGYSQAIGAQSGIDAAAQRALAATGTPYAAGSGAAVAGLGSSALSALNAQGAAANAYGAKLPSVAAGRGQFGVQSLENARQQAMQQRNQSYQQAYLSALQTARQNAETKREFGLNLGLQNRQLNAQIKQNRVDNRYRYDALAQNQKQFKSGQTQQWQEYMAGLRAKIQAAAGGTGGGGTLAGYTPSEISGLQKRGNDYVANTAVIHGLPIQTTIKNLVAQGIPRQIAVYEAQEGYATMTAPTQAEFKGRDSQGNPTYNGLGYQQALRAYRSALGSFRKWVNQRQFRSQIKSQGLAPGQGRGVG